MPGGEQSRVGDSVVRVLESGVREMLAPYGEFKLLLRAESHPGTQYFGELERGAEVTVAIDGHLGQPAHPGAEFDIRRNRTVGVSLPAELRECFERSDRVVNNRALVALKLSGAKFQMASQCRRGKLVHGRAAVELNAETILIGVLPVAYEDPYRICTRR
jgi:hypothetical protein